MTKTKIPTRSVEDIVEELVKLKERKKDIEKREKQLKEDLEIILVHEGLKDSKGNISMIVGNRLAQRQARKSVKIDKEKAEQFFKERNLWDKVVKIEEVLDEDAIEQLVIEGKISVEDLETITNVKTTYAIIIKDYKQEEMPTISS